VRTQLPASSCSAGQPPSSLLHPIITPSSHHHSFIPFSLLFSATLSVAWSSLEAFASSVISPHELPQVPHTLFSFNWSKFGFLMHLQLHEFDCDEPSTSPLNCRLCLLPPQLQVASPCAFFEIRILTQLQLAPQIDGPLVSCSGFKYGPVGSWHVPSFILHSLLILSSFIVATTAAITIMCALSQSCHMYHACCINFWNFEVAAKAPAVGGM
jgi:hypothetical protein